jgi:hypothetical protein
MKTCLFWLSLMISTLSEAQIIGITETSYSNNKMIPDSCNVVDINSTLKVELNTDPLLLAISRATHSNQEQIKKLDQLNKVLEKKIKILQILSDSIQSDKESHKLQILANYSTLMKSFYEQIIEIPELREEANKLFEEYFDMRAKQILDKKEYPNPELYVIKNLSRYEKAIFNQIGQSDSLRKVNIQLVALLNTQSAYNQQVHIENFDNFQKGEYYVVNRWVTSFSEEDIEAFNKTGKLANQMNNVATEGFKGITELLAANFSSFNCSKELLKEAQFVKSNLGTIENENEEAVSPLVSQLSALLTDLITDAESITKLKSSELNALEQFNTVSSNFIAKANKLPNQIDSVFQSLPSAFLAANQQLVDLKNKALQCGALVKTDVEKVQGILNYVTSIFIPFKKSNDNAQSIQNDALSFTIDQLPPFGLIDLKTTGKRANGDQLEVKVRIKTALTEKQGLPQGITLETHTLTLQQTSVYSVSKVSLILANPYQVSNKVKLENEFQFAPSGSLLFKVGLRTSKTWNFVNPGLGFNMSTPDFDLDGVPDIALGAVASVLKDIVMIGWSYNTTTNSPFWFFGLSLPFNIPGVPINSVQTNVNSN